MKLLKESDCQSLDPQIRLSVEQMGLQKMCYACAGLVPILTSVIAFPVILIARHNKRIGDLYYWFIFAVSEYLFLSRADHHVRSLLFQPMAQDLEEKRRQAGGQQQQQLRVLEIGPGTGGNFAYYPATGISLTTLELNPLLEKHALNIKEKYPHLVIEESIIGNAEDMSVIPDESFDAVVGTHILCCIKNPETAAKEIHRVLKPGGKFYTVEYVLFPQQETRKRLLQKLYAPFWRFFGMGCKAGSQDCISSLQSAGLETQLIQRYQHPDLLVTHSLTEYGTAVKPHVVMPAPLPLHSNTSFGASGRARG